VTAEVARAAAAVVLLILGTGCQPVEDRLFQRSVRQAEAQRAVLCPECSILCFATDVPPWRRPCLLMKDGAVVDALHCGLGGCRRVEAESGGR